MAAGGSSAGDAHLIRRVAVDGAPAHRHVAFPDEEASSILRAASGNVEALEDDRAACNQDHSPRVLTVEDRPPRRLRSQGHAAGNVEHLTARAAAVDAILEFKHGARRGSGGFQHGSQIVTALGCIRAAFHGWRQRRRRCRWW